MQSSLPEATAIGFPSSATWRTMASTRRNGAEFMEVFLKPKLLAADHPAGSELGAVELVEMAGHVGFGDPSGSVEIGFGELERGRCSFSAATQAR